MSALAALRIARRELAQHGKLAFRLRAHAAAIGAVPSLVPPRNELALHSRTFSTTPEEHTFQAETRQLLDIVTNSLYTDKEVGLWAPLSLSQKLGGDPDPTVLKKMLPIYVSS